MSEKAVNAPPVEDGGGQKNFVCSIGHPDRTFSPGLELPEIRQCQEPSPAVLVVNQRLTQGAVAQIAGSVVSDSRQRSLQVWHEKTLARAYEFPSGHEDPANGVCGRVDVLQQRTGASLKSVEGHTPLGQPNHGVQDLLQRKPAEIGVHATQSGNIARDRH